MATRKTAKKSEFQKMQKQFCRAFILRVFAWFLFVLLALNIFVFISAGIWASNIQSAPTAIPTTDTSRLQAG